MRSVFEPCNLRMHPLLFAIATKNVAKTKSATSSPIPFSESGRSSDVVAGAHLGLKEWIGKRLESGAYASLIIMKEFDSFFEDFREVRMNGWCYFQ